MIKRSLISAAVLAGATLATAPSFAATNLVKNGSFEANTVDGTCPIAWTCTATKYMDYGAEPVSYWNDYRLGSHLAASPDGGNVGATWYIDHGRGLSQTLTGLTVGATYQLSFYEAAANRDSQWFAPGLVGWEVSVGGSVLGDANLTIPTPGNNTAWYAINYSFVANAANEVLNFLAQANVPIAPEPTLFLDGVKVLQTSTPPPVTTPVPEPSTWALTLAGLAVIGGIVRRRQAKKA